jgi:hypothetical protein
MPDERWDKEREAKLVRRRVSDFESQETLLRAKVRSYQVLVRNILHASVGMADRLEGGQYVRAGGDAVCKTCRLEYRQHPELPGYATIHLTCDGSIVKL